MGNPTEYEGADREDAARRYVERVDRELAQMRRDVRQELIGATDWLRRARDKAGSLERDALGVATIMATGDLADEAEQLADEAREIVRETRRMIFELRDLTGEPDEAAT